MPNLHFPSMTPTVVLRDYDPLADPTQSVSISYVPIIVDDTPLPPLAMVLIKIYVFGGLAFMFTVICASIAYWVWIVVIKREFADSPPELDLHPERMREREKARIARLKVKKEEKAAAQKRKQEEKFRIPPLKYSEQKGRSRPRPRPRPLPTKSALKSSTSSPTGKSNKSSSSSLSSKKGKHVSWASSISALESNGRQTKKPLPEDKSDDARIRSTRRQSPPRSLAGFQPQEHPRPLPKARPFMQRTVVYIGERDPRGQQLIGVMNPELARSWAQSSTSQKQTRHRPEPVRCFVGQGGRCR